MSKRKSIYKPKKKNIIKLEKYLKDGKQHNKLGKDI